MQCSCHVWPVSKPEFLLYGENNSHFLCKVRNDALESGGCVPKTRFSAKIRSPVEFICYGNEKIPVPTFAR